MTGRQTINSFCTRKGVSSGLVEGGREGGRERGFRETERERERQREREREKKERDDRECVKPKLQVQPRTCILP